jgi:multisubunit Na+/H+ antiporter MnhB subunit
VAWRVERFRQSSGFCDADLVAPGPLRRFFRDRPIIGLVAGAVVGLVLVAVLVVFDVDLVLQAYKRSASSTLAAVVIGAAAALATVVAFAWYRRRVGRLGGTARRLLGRAAIVWSGLFVVAFVWTHPRHRDDEFATPLEVAVVSYCLVIVVVAVCLVPVAVLIPARPASHGTRDRIRVWKVDDEEPYFIAYCDCGWVGTAYDVTDPEAREKAFRDARAHGTNVAPDVEQPLG